MADANLIGQITVAIGTLVTLVGAAVAVFRVRSDARTSDVNRAETINEMALKLLQEMEKRALAWETNYNTLLTNFTKLQVERDSLIRELETVRTQLHNISKETP